MMHFSREVDASVSRESAPIIFFLINLQQAYLFIQDILIPPQGGLVQLEVYLNLFR